MFDKLFPKKPSNADKPTDDTDPLQLAIAALLVEAARADNHYDEREREIIAKSLGARFSLTEEESAALRAKGETAQQNAADIQRFTKRAKAMALDEKIGFIELLWEIVLSDGERDPYEDTLIRRICGLIYVEDRVSGEARKRVEARLKPE